MPEGRRRAATLLGQPEQHLRHAPVPQSAEGADSKPAQCAFESHRGHSDIVGLSADTASGAVPCSRGAPDSRPCPGKPRHPAPEDHTATARPPGWLRWTRITVTR
jgi:hypothetical protein